jgi:phage gp29-like protein
VEILDQFGKPMKVTAAALSKELARPSLTGIRQAWGAGAVSNGLTPQRLAAILRAADSGDHHAYLSLAEEMEERDAHYGSVLRTRKLAVSGLDIVVESASDDPRDIALADAVREQVTSAEFGDAVDDLLDGLGKGYSAVEIIWQRGEFWQPTFKWRDPRFFRFDRETGTELRLLDEADMINGVALEKYRWITHIPKLKSGLTVRSGLARMAAIAYMCKTWTIKDWMTFADVFGLPLRVGKYGRGATDDEIDTLITAISNIASDAGAVIPESMNIEFVEAAKSSGGGTGVFKELADYLDGQTSKAVIGQTMTSDNGSSQAQANVHNEVRLDIVKSDAKQLTSTLNRDFVPAFVDINYGVPKHYPRVFVYVPDNEDLALLVTALEKLVPLGLEVEQSVIRDKFGLPDPDRDSGGNAKGKLLGAPVAGNVQPTAANHATALNTSQSEVSDELDLLAEDALGGWERVMTPVISPIEALVANSASYKDFLTGLTELTRTTDATALIESLALATFKARGLGDGSHGG